MDSEVHHTSSPGEIGIVKPGLVRTVGVMEDEITRENFADAALEDSFTYQAHALGKAIGKIDAEKAVRFTGNIHDGRHLGGGASQGLLAKYRETVLESTDALFCMQSA